MRFALQIEIDLPHLAARTILSAPDLKEEARARIEKAANEALAGWLEGIDDEKTCRNVSINISL